MYNSQDEWNDENLSRGAGDPDAKVYPSERHYIGVDKPVIQITIPDELQGRRVGYPYNEVDYNPLFDEDLEREENDSH